MENTNSIYEDELMAFGKYKNYRMKDIPAKYLLDLYFNDNLMGLPRMYVATNLEALKQKAKQ